jgi:two-component system chemotaxis response regulator CheB
MAYELIAIGCSWGGLRALELVLGALPAEFPAAVVIAQHRSPESPRNGLAGLLESSSALPVTEVEDKDPIEAGHVYVAPADYHLLVEPGYFSLSTDGPVQFARPSVDVLFESAADSYGDRLVAVVLTGANEDGAHGAQAVKKHRGLVFAQHPDSAEKAAMPEAAIATRAVDRVVALADLGPQLAGLFDPVSAKDVKR